MNHNYLKTAFFIAAATAFAASGANAQENTLKSNSVGPTIEFSNGSTAIGLKGKFGVSSQFSIRPTILFGYASDLQKAANSNNLNPGSGGAYGAAITYDFDLADKKFSAYVGPRALFSNGSVTTSINGTQVASLSYNQTDIGLLLGGDYRISDNFTAGVNVIYNFAKSGSATLSTPLGTQSQNGSIDSNGLDFGINFAYMF